MNCDALQKHLLGLEDPGRPADEARAHLAACASCRDWQRHLLLMERAVSRLPVPSAADARDALLRRILTGPGAGRPVPEAAGGRRRPSVAMMLGSLILDRHASPRRRVGAGLVAGLAAALLLFLLGGLVLLTGSHDESPLARARKPAPDALVAELMRHNLKLAEARTPRERVELMAGVADNLHTKGHTLARAGSADDLAVLAALYGRVVREGVLKRAAELPPGQRREVLAPIADRLTEAQGQAQRWALETDMPPPSKEALAQIARAAGEGSAQLQKMFAEG
jgi:hypothetical protein